LHALLRNLLDGERDGGRLGAAAPRVAGRRVGRRRRRVRRADVVARGERIARGDRRPAALPAPTRTGADGAASAPDTCTMKPGRRTVTVCGVQPFAAAPAPPQSDVTVISP